MAAMNDVFDQFITDRCALFNGDCVQGMQKLPSGSVHFTVYSPHLAGCITILATTATCRIAQITTSF